MAIKDSTLLGEEIRQLIGAPRRCRNFSIHFPAGGEVTVKCEYYPGMPPKLQASLKTLLAGYELTPRRKKAGVR